MRGAPADKSRALTIDAALGAPFPTNPAVSLDGEQVAWVYEHQGIRNIWVASADPAQRSTARAVTAYADDDGYDLTDLSWSAGETLVFARGGAENGAAVNPSSRPSGGAEREIWAVATRTGASHRVGPGHSPVVAPKGDRVAFIADDQVWLASLAGEAKPVQLIHDQGKSAAITWSPNGRRLAFVSARGDHALVGVYDFDAATLTWLAPSTDTDSAPAWSPDGQHIAFLRAPAGWDQTRFAHRSDRPWSIWVADSATGVGHAVWTADPGPGSAFNPGPAARKLLWAAGDRLIFFWEKTGWRHLYSITAAGTGPLELTPGAFEVFDVVLSPGLRTAFYSSNQDDLDRRHIWAVAVGGGPARRLGKGGGIEANPQACGEERVFAVHGDGRNPLRPVILGRDGSIRDVVDSRELVQFPVDELVEPQPIALTAADGLSLHGQLFLPPRSHGAHSPAIIFFHGGPVQQMLLGWHPERVYTYLYAMNQHLASAGYLVLSVNYRGGEGYGLSFREADNTGPTGASELNDIIGAARFLSTRADVDPKRIGLWGGSYGGLMTALGLSHAPELFAAGVDIAGLHDWRTYAAYYGISGLPAEVLQAMYASSVVGDLDKWKAPVLLVHADDDRNVPFSQTVELVQGLRKHGVDVQQLVLPDESHDLQRGQSWLRVLHATDDFFRAHLGPVN